MNLIEFDKLANVVFRLWSELFRKTGDEVWDKLEELAPNELQSIVRFRPPFEELPGLHGPGECRANAEGRQKYLIRMLRELADEDVGYFAFEHTGGPLVEGEEEDPTMVSVRASLLVSDDPGFWDGFTQAESGFLRSVAGAVASLTPAQIRSLGTHCAARSTLEEVQREWKWARQEARTIRKALREGVVPMRPAARLGSALFEAGRKAEGNTASYSEGFRFVVSELDGLVREAFLVAQRPGDEIWSGDELRRLGRSASAALPVADLISAIAKYQVGLGRGKAGSKGRKTAESEWEQSRDAVLRLGSALPPTIAAALVDSRVRQTVADQLASALDRVGL